MNIKIEVSYGNWNRGRLVQLELKKGYVYVIYDKVNSMFLFGETGGNGNERIAAHLRDIRRGEERNKPLQKAVDKYGESRFISEVIIETINHEHCERVLIELFLRVEKTYNERRTNKINEVERGTLEIPVCVYKEVETYLHQSHCNSPYYNELLIELEDMKVRFESKSEKIYNRDFKKVFLSKNYRSNEKTADFVRKLFKVTYKLEAQWDKDLHDFTFEEAEEVLVSFGAGTKDSLRNIKSKLSVYLDFSIEQGVSINKDNYFKNLSEKNSTDKYLDKSKEFSSIFDSDEVMAMAMGADNPQDGVILGLLFDGINIRNEFEELTNLNICNIDMEKMVITVNERTFPMSAETSILVKEALDQDMKYTSASTDADSAVKTVRNYKIAEGDNVLRGLRGKNTVKGQIISQRILRIAEINDHEYLNATAISYSGQLHYANKLIKEEGCSLEDTIEKVLERFAIPSNTSSRFYLRTRIERYLQMRG